MARWTCARSHFLSAIAAILLVGVAAFAQDVEYKDGVFRLLNYSGQTPESALAVYAAGADTPMLGTYSKEGDTLVFRPRFRLSSGVAYRAVFPGGTLVVDA